MDATQSNKSIQIIIHLEARKKPNEYRKLIILNVD